MGSRTPDDTFADWKTRLEYACREIDWLLLSRQTFEELQILISTHAKSRSDGRIWSNNWLAANYAIATSIRIRAQRDRDPRTDSLRRVLEEITQSPEVLTRERFLAPYRQHAPHDLERGNAVFDQFAGPGGNCVNPERVRADIERMESELAYVKDYADTRAAHLDRSATITAIRPQDLNRALEVLKELAQKYLALFNFRHRDPFFGMHRSDEWKTFFLEDWGEEGPPPPR